MSDIKVGDRVTWVTGLFRGRQVIDTVRSISYSNVWGENVAHTDGYGRVPISKLTRVTDSDLVAAIAAQPLDDQAREEVVASLRLPPSPLEIITTDYEEAMLREAGNLGVWEP